uniref:Uncharacterized protein n=1 Tax=Anopheles albimanus TaxID=7167 RepID=A0A182F8J6_ANOAL
MRKIRSIIGKDSSQRTTFLPTRLVPQPCRFRAMERHSIHSTTFDREIQRARSERFERSRCRRRTRSLDLLTPILIGCVSMARQVIPIRTKRLQNWKPRACVPNQCTVLGSVRSRSQQKVTTTDGRR